VVLSLAEIDERVTVSESSSTNGTIVDISIRCESCSFGIAFTNRSVDEGDLVDEWVCVRVELVNWILHRRVSGTKDGSSDGLTSGPYRKVVPLSKVNKF
jgi:hypothetical protein